MHEFSFFHVFQEADWTKLLRVPLKSRAWGGHPTCHPQTPVLHTPMHVCTHPLSLSLSQTYTHTHTHTHPQSFKINVHVSCTSCLGLYVWLKLRHMDSGWVYFICNYWVATWCQWPKFLCASSARWIQVYPLKYIQPESIHPSFNWTYNSRQDVWDTRTIIYIPDEATNSELGPSSVIYSAVIPWFSTVYEMTKYTSYAFVPREV